MRVVHTETLVMPVMAVSCVCEGLGWEAALSPGCCINSVGLVLICVLVCLLCVHYACALQRAYRDHQAEKRMKDLIAEEEEAGRLEDERAAARAAADKEKRAKKKERKKVGRPWPGLVLM